MHTYERLMCVLVNVPFTQIVNIGVKVMARCDHVKTSCDFRLCQEVQDLSSTTVIVCMCVYKTCTNSLIIGL